MAYSTPADVRDALRDAVNIDEDEVTGANLDDDQLEDQIAEADATIDTYIGRYYATPVDVSGGPVEPVRSWSRSIAAYLATLAYRMSQDSSDQDPVYRRYAHTMAQLVGVSKGELKVNLPTLPESSTQNDVAIANRYEGDLFVPGDFSIGEAPTSPDWNVGTWPFRGLR